MAYKMLDGNYAACEALRLARVKVLATYPITPQSPISEKLAEYVGGGIMDAQYIRVESEHSAMSAVMTAQLTGVRASTATSSQGLALMSEVLSMVSGMRAPVVAPIVNRAVAAPWSLWCEHGDSMSQRDMGWMQFFCQNVQEVLDLVLVAYKVAENPKVLTPAMVCFDGFFLSHSMQKIDVPEEKPVDSFLGEYQHHNMILDPKDPAYLCNLTSNSDYTEMRYQQKRAMDGSISFIESAMAEYNKLFDRDLSVVEGYQTEDADVVLTGLGSMCGTGKYVVNKMRAEGKKVGFLKVTVFRPFPYEKILAELKGKAVVGVIDRSSGLGSQGAPMWTEVCSALKNENSDVRSYVGGLGGRDIPPHNLEKMFNELLDIKNGNRSTHTSWFDLKDNYMNIREVDENA